jgi:hypothetical protein
LSSEELAASKGTMPQNTKRITLLFLVGTLVSLIMLSGSLSNLQLHAGAPFPSAGDFSSETRFFTTPSPGNANSLTLLKGIFALIFLFLMIYVTARFVALVNIKRLIRLLSIMTAMLALIILISHIPITPSTPHPSETTINPISPRFEYPVSPLGQPPGELILLVLIAFIVAVGLLVFKVLGIWLKQTGMTKQILHEAESAMNEIKSGENLRNVIFRCYIQMAHVFQEERKIERNYNMTVREFEDWLEEKGFPIVPIHQLTHLFEKARYGTQLTMKEDEKMAVESLDEIIRFCRSERN